MRSLTWSLAVGLAVLVLTLPPMVQAEEVMSSEDILNSLENKMGVVGRSKAADPPDQQGALKGLGQLDLTVQFALNSDAIETASFALLINLGQAIADPRMGSQRVLIAGHTDARGTDEHNMLLSQRRAAAVKLFLSSVKPEISGRLEAIGFGESRLKNQSEPEAAENRRVQIVNLGQ